jgi:hypothetical protein
MPTEPSIAMLLLIAAAFIAVLVLLVSLLWLP